MVNIKNFIPSKKKYTIRAMTDKIRETKNFFIENSFFG